MQGINYFYCPTYADNKAEFTSVVKTVGQMNFANNPEMHVLYLNTVLWKNGKGKLRNQNSIRFKVIKTVYYSMIHDKFWQKAGDNSEIFCEIRHFMLSTRYWLWNMVFKKHEPSKQIVFQPNYVLLELQEIVLKMIEFCQ